MSTVNSSPSLIIIGTGDNVLDVPDVSRFFAPSAELLQAADVLIAQVEVLCSDRPEYQPPALTCPPLERLQALADVGVDIATLAGNHIWDHGPGALEDTLDELHRLGIPTSGGGRTLAEAREPAIVERNGIRVGSLAYNCVGPREAWAKATRGGCAYVQVISHYEMDYASPGAPPTAYTFAAPKSVEAMEADIEALRPQVDVLVVSLHKGMTHTPVELADYERPVAKAAIDAGADIILSHHAHIGRGIEFHHGRPIYHGLGNFVAVTPRLTLNNSHPDRKEWAERRRKIFGFAPDPEMPDYYAYHPESRNTMLARIVVSRAGIEEAGFYPVWEDAEARPVPLTDEDSAQDVLRYFDKVTRSEGLRTTYTWKDDHVVAQSSS